MKDLRKNKKFVFGASLALTLVMLLAATFAWFSQTDQVDNEFSTGGLPKDSVKVWEIFEEPDEWKPGQEVNKDVGVINRGDMPVVVRASFSEVLQKMKADGNELEVVKSATMKPASETEFKVVPSIDYAANADWKEASTDGFTVIGLPADAKLYVRRDRIDGKEIISYAARSTQGGVVSGTFKLASDNTTVNVTNVTFDYYQKAASLATDWTTDFSKTNTDTSHLDNLIKLGYHNNNMTTDLTNAAGKWFYNATDGWFYYIGVVQGGTITPLFLSNVTLDGSANNTYQYLNYRLTITANGLQASKAAIEGDWNLVPGTPLYEAIASQLTE